MNAGLFRPLTLDCRSKIATLSPPQSRSKQQLFLTYSQVSDNVKKLPGLMCDQVPELSHLGELWKTEGGDIVPLESEEPLGILGILLVSDVIAEQRKGDDMLGQIPSLSTFFENLFGTYCR